MLLLDSHLETVLSVWSSPDTVRHEVKRRKPARQLPDQQAATVLFADSLFQFLQASENCIPWDFPEDYCFARAHATFLLIKERFRTNVGKMYISPTIPTEELKLRLKLPSNALYDSVRWNGHITTFIARKGDTLILDPALTDRAVSKADYLKQLNISLQDFTIEYGDGDDYCMICQTKFNYYGQEAVEVTQRAINESRQRREQYIKETEIERHYKTCANFLLFN